MRNILAIAAAVIADAVRRKVLYIILVFAAILAFMIPQLPTYGVGVVAAVYREISLALVFAASLVLTLSLAANRLPSEVERRTVYNVLSKRVRRWQYVVGTWLGIAGVMAVAIAAFVAVTQAAGFMRYGEAMWRLWEGGLGIWLEMSALAAFAVGVSTITGPVVVVTASLVFLFAAHSRDALVASAPEWLARLYPSFDTFNVIAPVAHGGGLSLGYTMIMLGVFAAYSAVLLLAGSALFATRDL